MIECPDCEKQIRGTTCRHCGWSAKPASKPAAVPETSRPYVAPVYPDPPATPEQARKALDEIYKLLGAKMTAPGDKVEGSRFTYVDPTVRRHVEGKP